MGFYHDYIKTKKIRQCMLYQITRDSFRDYIKAKDCFLKEFETRFDTLNYEIERSLTIRKND